MNENQVRKAMLLRGDRGPSEEEVAAMEARRVEMERAATKLFWWRMGLLAVAGIGAYVGFGWGAAMMVVSLAVFFRG